MKGNGGLWRWESIRARVLGGVTGQRCGRGGEAEGRRDRTTGGEPGQRWETSQRQSTAWGASPASTDPGLDVSLSFVNLSSERSNAGLHRLQPAVLVFTVNLSDSGAHVAVVGTAPPLNGSVQRGRQYNLWSPRETDVADGVSGRWWWGGQTTAPEAEGASLAGRGNVSTAFSILFLYLFAALWKQARRAASGPGGQPPPGWWPHCPTCSRLLGSLQWLRCSPSASGPPPALLLSPQRPARQK